MVLGVIESYRFNCGLLLFGAVIKRNNPQQLSRNVLVRLLYTGLPSKVPLTILNTIKMIIDKVMITAKLIQYVFTLYTPSRSLIWTEKYPVIRLTGRNRMVTLARRTVMRVNFSMAWDSFRAIRLKFYTRLVASGLYFIEGWLPGTPGTLSPSSILRSDSERRG